VSEPTLDLADVQGGVLRGYGFGFGDYALVRGVTPAWLGGVADAVTSAEPWAQGKPEVAVNVALTAPGLEALGVGLDGFPGEFRAGMASRAARLGDTGHNAPSEWDAGLGGRGEGHVLLWTQGRSLAAVNERLDALLGDVEVVWRHESAALPHGREHFGFSDGFAQPSVAGSGQENRPGEGVPVEPSLLRRLLARRPAPSPNGPASWRLLRPGELVLGYEDEDGLLPPAPPAPLHRNATFMVLRKLRQDVAAWKAWLRAHADDAAAGDEDWLAAKVVGRWPDGTPLALAPERPQQRSVTGLHETNAFGYADDPGGRRCPVGAHVRRTNPREGMAGGAARTRRHRIVRRGMPYGLPLAGEEDDGVDRGLLFSCFNASIARQFEVVQGWSVDGNVFGLGPGDRDMFAGADDGSQSFTIPGEPPYRLPGPGRPLVTVRGGEYLFLPSIGGLRAIAEGRA
jgi:Dyp-type peroxidase family